MTQEQIITMMANTLNMAEGDLIDDMDRDHDEWDSLDMVGLLAAISRAGIIVPPMDVPRIRTVTGVIDIFRQAGKLE